MDAAFQLECLPLKYKMNHFALPSKLYINAIRQAMAELAFAQRPVCVTSVIKRHCYGIYLFQHTFLDSVGYGQSS